MSAWTLRNVEKRQLRAQRSRPRGWLSCDTCLWPERPRNLGRGPLPGTLRCWWCWDPAVRRAVREAQSRGESISGRVASLDLVYGDGSDGDVVLPPGVTSITRNMNYNKLIFERGARLQLNGYRVRIRQGIFDEESNSVHFVSRPPAILVES